MIDFPLDFVSAVLEQLRSPLGALIFIPLYAVWVTLLLPGCGLRCWLACFMAPGLVVAWCFLGHLWERLLCFYLRDLFS